MGADSYSDHASEWQILSALSVITIFLNIFTKYPAVFLFVSYTTHFRNPLSISRYHTFVTTAHNVHLNLPAGLWKSFSSVSSLRVHAGVLLHHHCCIPFARRGQTESLGSGRWIPANVAPSEWSPAEWRERERVGAVRSVLMRLIILTAIRLCKCTQTNVEKKASFTSPIHANNYILNTHTHT